MKKLIIVLFMFFIGILTTNALPESLSLINLSVTGASLDPTFNSNTTFYRVRVKNNIKSINIYGYLKDKESTILSGIGNNQDIIVGNNRFEIKIRDINKNESSYILVVSREDENGNIPTHTYSGFLKELSIDEYSLFFEPKELNYDIEVPNNIQSLTIKSSPLEKNLQVEILGNKNFKVGNNIVQINLKNNNDIIRTYIINVTREEVKEAPKEKDIYYILKNANDNPIKIQLEVPQILDTIALEYLVDTKKNAIFEYKDNENNVTHSLGVYYNNITNKHVDINLEAYLNKEYKYNKKDSLLIDLRQKTFPGNIEVNINTIDVFKNNDTIELFNKDDRKYTKISDIKISDDKLSFNISKGGEYVLVLKNIKKIEKEKQAKQIIYISILSLLNILAIIRLIKVMRK